MFISIPCTFQKTLMTVSCTKSSVSFDLAGPEREACGEPSVVIETYNVGPAVEVLMDRPLRTGQQAKGAFGFSAGYGDCGTGARLVRSLVAADKEANRFSESG